MARTLPAAVDRPRTSATSPVRCATHISRDGHRYGVSVVTPQRFLLLVGVPLGLILALVSPPWTAGADEATHFARAVDVAGGNLYPDTLEEGIGSRVPATYVDDFDLVILNFLEGGDPINAQLVGDLLDHGPDGRTRFVDTKPTNASTPVGYLPAALGMAVPHATDAPAVLVLWLGRLSCLAVYLGVAYLAVRSAVLFRWTLVLTALFPLNLALGASVSPDGLTISAVLLVVAVATRLWTEQLDTRRALLEVGGASLLLALAKPPYFLALGLFGVIALLRRRDTAALVAGGVAAVAGAIGAATSLANSANNSYQGVTTTIIDNIAYQPEIQRERLISDPVGFLEIVTRTWFRELPADYVPIWFRQLGFFESGVPIVLVWALVIGSFFAVMRLDGDDYLAVRSWLRGAFAAGTALFVVVLYASSYIYFDDTVEGARIGRQMARYVLPLLPLALIGFAPRFVIGWTDGLDRLRDRHLHLVLVAVPTVAVVASLVHWLITGDDGSFGDVAVPSG